MLSRSTSVRQHPLPKNYQGTGEAHPTELSKPCPSRGFALSKDNRGWNGAARGPRWGSLPHSGASPS